jgi:hypothetical protein
MGPDGRPAFAKDFPRVASVDGLVAAFARGDYAKVRAEGRRLDGAEGEPEEVRLAVRTLVSRTEPDPLAVWLMVLTGVLLLTLTLYWTVHGRAPMAPGHAPALSSPARSSPAAT